MRMIGLFRLAGICCLLLVMSAAAREFTPEFRHLDKSAGMSASTVWAVAQDHDGFMWLATNDGLMRFDGRDFQVFRHQPGDPNSMPGNNVQNVMVDSQNTVWAAIEDHGLVWLDARQRQINNLRHDSKSENVLLGPDVFAFEEDQQQRLWLGFYGKGLQLLDLKTKKLEDVPLALSNATVLSIAVENDDAIWVGTMAGLDRVYRDQGRWFVQNALRGPMVVGVMRAIDGSFIAASDEGAYRSSLTPTGVKTEWFDMHLAGQQVLQTAQTKTDAIWAATPFGLSWRRWDGQLRQLFQSQSALQNSLPSDELRDVLTDREDGLWIGSNGSGLAYLNPHWQNFTVLRHNVLDARSLPKGRPNAITSCLDDTVFISNSDGDFLRIDANGQRHTDFSARWRKSLPNQEVWSLQCDEASVWIGHNRGLSRVDRKSGAINHWHSEKTPYPKGALTLLVEQGDWLWSAVKGQALVRMNRRTGEIETIAAEVGAPSTDYEQIRTMPSGELWVATAEGLFQFEPNQKRLLAIPGAPKVRIDNFLMRADQSANQSVWLHDQSGLRLYLWNKQQLTLQHEILAGASLPAMEVGAMELDAQQNLWLAGPRGLWRVNAKDHRLQQMGLAQGLNMGGFSALATMAKTKSTWWLLGEAGVVGFEPEAVSMAVPPPPVQWIRGMFRSSAGETFLDLQTPVQLNHRDRELSFTIRALSFIEPNQHRYQYQLVGFDDDWVEVDASGVRTFSQLPSGQFTLRARAMVAGADWVEASQQVQIHVAPPPWKTVPAYLAYAAMVLTLLWMILRQLKRRLQERHQTALIAQEKEFAVRANQAKRDFLADVGHEIRTPMSGLLGMTDLLLDSNLNANQRENAEIVRRSGHHLLRLVNDLLDLSKIEAGKASLHEETVNLPDLIQEVVHIERPLIQSKSLRLVTEFDPKLPTWIHVDGQRLRQILFNLLGNAVKFTERGEIVLRLTRVDEDQWCLQVQDSGPGMNQAALRQLRQRFSQAGVGESGKYGGSGLGLAICQKLTELMRGEMKIDSVEGQGSTITVQLPLQAVTREAVRMDASVFAHAHAHAHDRNGEHALESGQAQARTHLDRADRNTHASTSVASITHEKQVDLRRDASPSQRKQLRVVAVDDDATVRKLIEQFVAQQGHTIQTAEHGLALIPLLESMMVDLFILDLDMPSLDGFALCQLIRAQSKHQATRIVALTARADSQTQTRCLEAGFDRFYRKPVTRTVVETILEDWMNDVEKNES